MILLSEIIISRKATDLSKITEETYRGYLKEFSQKYSIGTKISSNAYPDLNEKILEGNYIFEIPARNANISGIEHYKDIAKEYNVKAMGFIGGKLGPKSLLR